MKNPKTQRDLLGRLYQLRDLSYQDLKKRIKINEGFSLNPYKDQLGFLTIGYGHLVTINEKNLLKKKLNKKKLEIIFEKDFKKALRDYNIFLKKFSSNKKEAELLIEMVYQIGIKGVLNFKKLLRNMSNGNMHLVCFEMMESLWYKQTPERVKNLINVFLK